MASPGASCRSASTRLLTLLLSPLVHVVRPLGSVIVLERKGPVSLTSICVLPVDSGPYSITGTLFLACFYHPWFAHVCSSCWDCNANIAV